MYTCCCCVIEARVFDYVDVVVECVCAVDVCVVFVTVVDVSMFVDVC